MVRKELTGPSLRQPGSSRSDRHCEPTDRANARPAGWLREAIHKATAVIASEAQLSLMPRIQRMDCFAARARTAAPPRRDAPESLMKLSPKRGAGHALLRGICIPNIAPCWLTWRQ